MPGVRPLQPTCYPCDCSSVNEDGKLCDGLRRHGVARTRLTRRYQAHAIRFHPCDNGLVNSLQDYLSLHDARLVPEDDGTRLLVEDNNVIFEQRSPDEVRHVVNRAVGVAILYFQRNLSSAGAPPMLVSAQQVEQVAIKVALHHLYIYNGWKNFHEEYRDHDLTLTDEDLSHPYTRDEVMFYCEATFPATYQSMAALLLNESPEDFIKWERGRRAFWDRF